MTAALRVIEVPFHIGDFLSGTMHMDATETGAYWMLCVAHYQAGAQGLPNDDVKLARIARVSLHTWRRMCPTLMAKFSVEGEFIRHRRVTEVLTKISEKSDAARASALTRLTPGAANARRTPGERSANHQPITDKVIKPEEGNTSARYDVERAVRFPVLLKAKARAKELNRDFAELCRLYNAWIDKRGIPGDADDAFLGWIEKFTKGKRL
jgi:uncharacterized protein YdaU (DUF1376 family)